MGFIDGSHPCPDDFIPTTDTNAVPQANLTHAVWFHHDQALMSMLIFSLSEEVMHLAVSHRTSQQIWELIEMSLECKILSVTLSKRKCREKMK